jgi:hypothetical protein
VISSEIANKEAEEIYNRIVKQFKNLSDDPEQIDLQQMWKLFNKLWPKNKSSLPVAKRNHKGRIVSSHKDIKKLLVREYKNRLRCRPTRPDLKAHKIRRNKIFELKIQLAKMKKSPDWTMKQLESALARLKNNKSRDPLGYINEIFKKNVIGDNLKKSLLFMMTQIKKTLTFPDLMKYANITTVPKPGSRLELKNERGIFRCAIVRCILMGLIYELKYETVDSNMSDCQIRARKKKGCKYNINIINGIIHDEQRKMSQSCSRYTIIHRCLIQLT